MTLTLVVFIQCLLSVCLPGFNYETCSGLRGLPIYSTPAAPACRGLAVDCSMEGTPPFFAYENLIQTLSEPYPRQITICLSILAILAILAVMAIFSPSILPLYSS